MEQNFDIYAPNREEEKAGLLLYSVLPAEAWTAFKKKRVIILEGERNTYVLSPTTQTEIRDKQTGRLLARACLQLSIPAPRYDRLLAEYLILKNDEDFYWKTANIFSQNGWDLAVPILIVGNLVLLINLLLEILSVR